MDWISFLGSEQRFFLIGALFMLLLFAIYFGIKKVFKKKGITLVGVRKELYAAHNYLQEVNKSLINLDKIMNQVEEAI